jgi:hypothetical protein
VAAALPVVSLARACRPAVLEVGSVAIAGLGVFWFVARACGWQPQFSPRGRTGMAARPALYPGRGGEPVW